MTRDEAIQEAKRLFEYEGTLTIPPYPMVSQQFPTKVWGREVGPAGFWVQAMVFVPAPKPKEEVDNG